MGVSLCFMCFRKICEKLLLASLLSVRLSAHLASSVCPSVCLPGCQSGRNNSAQTGRSFIKFDIVAFFENLSRKYKFHFNLTRITGTLHDVKVIFIVISRSVILRVRNVSDKSCRENQNTNVMLNKFFSKIVRFF